MDHQPYLGKYYITHMQITNSHIIFSQIFIFLSCLHIFVNSVENHKVTGHSNNNIIIIINNKIIIIIIIIFNYIGRFKFCVQICKSAQRGFHIQYTLLAKLQTKHIYDQAQSRNYQWLLMK